MDATKLVGCCGWSEAQARYFADFGTIELQTPFYQPPADRVAARWKALAPEGFVFCMKAWQLITHTPASPTYRRLKVPVSAQESSSYGNFRDTEQVRLAWERTREIAAILDARVIVFQCPGSFLPTAENRRNLRVFFGELERDGRGLAWEPRGDEWAPELIREICEEHGLIHCVDPFVHEATHGEVIYWRLHGRGGYRYVYTDADLMDLRRMSGSQNRAHYIQFNNMTSREDALRFRAVKLTE